MLEDAGEHDPLRKTNLATPGSIRDNMADGREEVVFDIFMEE